MRKKKQESLTKKTTGKAAMQLFWTLNRKNKLLPALLHSAAR
jgi:hypothetical protein